MNLFRGARYILLFLGTYWVLVLLVGLLHQAYLARPNARSNCLRELVNRLSEIKTLETRGDPVNEILPHTRWPFVKDPDALPEYMEFDLPEPY